MTWIKCSEQPPDIGEPVLYVARSRSGVRWRCIGHRRFDGWIDYEESHSTPEWNINAVTHWQPLPPLPEEE